jgi:hypothetical protein
VQLISNFVASASKSTITSSSLSYRIFVASNTFFYDTLPIQGVQYDFLYLRATLAF